MRPARALTLAILGALALLVCSPVIFLLSGAIMDPLELRDHLGPVLSGGGYVNWRLLPEYPSLQPVVELLLDSPEFFHTFWNSAAISGGVLLGHLVIGAPAAWGFARYDFPLRGALFGLYMILMLMPFQVTMLSSYLALDRLGLMDSLWAVILPSAFSTFPVFIMYRFFRAIPKAIIESAMLDARNPIQLFLYIGLPLGSAGIVSALALGFLESWNLIEQPMAFLKDKTLWPLSLYLPNISLENAGPAFAGAVVTLAPAFFVFLLGREHLEQGIAAAAVKE